MYSWSPRNLVVVSVGAFGSPRILERSGVGAPDVLERAGVTRVEEFPGVGASLPENQTYDPIASRRVDPGELIATNAGIVGWNAQDVTCKLRPNESDVASLGPAFQEVWNRDFKNITDKPLMISPFTGFPGDPTGIPTGQCFANTHSMGTNKIAPRENGGVVDLNLGVYGLEALKVADLSIAPANITANTADTAFAIGEKAADILIKELGLAK
ncbi:putative alcohol dehydrogenase [Seiridium cupressi]